MIISQDRKSNISSKVTVRKCLRKFLFKTMNFKIISHHYIGAETYRKVFSRVTLKQFFATVLGFMITMKERNTS